VEAGDLEIKIEHKHDDEFRYIYRRFNAMLDKINLLINQVFTQRILTQKAELKQLQSQVNPHFLYNCFFILYNIAYAEGCDTVARFANQLGNYFQLITRSAKDEVPLSREVEHARVYTEIQTMRFSNRISVQFEELPECYAGLIVPRLILQPVIENAYEHGLARVKAGGWIHISFHPFDGRLCIRVEDNGEGLEAQEFQRLRDVFDNKIQECEATGMINIHRRLQIRFGAESKLAISGGEAGGTKVEIIIRLQEGGNVQTTPCG